MCLGFVKDYAGFMVVRAILGITEGGLLPGIVSRIPLVLNAIDINILQGLVSIRHVHKTGDGT